MKKVRDEERRNLLTFAKKGNDSTTAEQREYCVEWLVVFVFLYSCICYVLLGIYAGNLVPLLISGTSTLVL